MLQIHIASPKAKAMMAPDFELNNDGYRPMLEAKTNASKYPFRRMQVGHCFIVPYGDKETTRNLRTAVSKANNSKLGRKFVIIRHDEDSIFEVARIA